MLNCRAALFAIIMLWACAANAEDIRVSITAATGTTMIRATEKAEWTAVKKQSDAGVDAWIKTEKNSDAVVGWGRGHSVKVGPLSLVKINKLVLSKEENIETTELEVRNGRCVAKVKKLQSSGSTFNIKTPSGVSGVRGTAFAVEVGEDGASQFMAIEDTIFVMAQDVEIVLEAGWEVAVEPDMPPQDPQQILPETMQKLEQELDDFAPQADAGEAAGDNSDLSEEAIDAAVDTVEEILDDIPVDVPVDDHQYYEEW